MRRKVQGALAVLLLLVAGCGTDHVFPVTGVADVEPAILDFGRVALGSTAVREVRIHNRGRAPLHLRDFEIEGLGDDIEIATRTKDHVKGGETIVLAVRYTPQREAVLERLLGLEVDDGKRPTFSVPVTGVGVRPRVTVEPPSLEFGRIEIGVPEHRTVTLRNEFDMPVEVTLGRRGDVQYSFEPGERVEVPANGSIEVDVRYLPTRTGRAEAQVAVLPCPSCTEQSVPLNGTGIDQALVVVPDVIDFGYVPLDRSAEREFTVSNMGSHTLEVRNMRLAQATVFEVFPEEAVLEEGEQISVRMRFTPGSKGLATDTLHIESSSVRRPTTDVAVRGTGGGPEIKVAWDDGDCLDFGAAPLGSRPYRYLHISNVGGDGIPLTVTDIYAEPGPGLSQLFGTDHPLPFEVPVGGTVSVAIWYEPNAASMTVPDVGSIAVVSDDGLAPTVRVCARGSAVEPPPCDGLEISPSVLDFGTLDERRGAALSILIRNTGDTVCLLRDLNIAAGSDPVFWTRPIASFDIRPQGWFGWEVYFDPARAGAGLGTWSGELELYAVNAADARYAVPLRARSGNGCLVPEPRYIDFGDDPAGCGTRGDGVIFTNTCTVPTVVGGIELGEPTTEGEFEISAAPATPFVLPPGDSFSVAVEWLSQTRGINSVPLYVYEDGRSGPLMVPLKGELTAEGLVSDEFVQHDPRKSDILVVVDNSATMREEQAIIHGAIGTLVTEGQSRGVDYRIAVTTTGVRPPPGPVLEPCPGGADGAEAGRFFPVDGSRPRIVTPTTPNGAGVLADNTQVGLCHQQEEGMQAMRLALSEPLRSGSNSGFLRDDAHLSVLFISEADDHSGFPVNDYLSFLQGLKGHGGAQAHAIVDVNDLCADTSGVAHRYLQLVRATGGVSGSICAPGWGSTLSQVATNAYTPRSGFTLSQTPDAGGIEVLVNGVPSPPSAWTYDAGTRTLRFAAGSTPAPGARIRVNYTASCR